VELTERIKPLTVQNEIQNSKVYRDASSVVKGDVINKSLQMSMAEKRGMT
jgi:hypothetical protein